MTRPKLLELAGPKSIAFASGALVLLTLAIAATWSVWTEIASRALHNPEDSHIMLALPVALWLVLLRRRRLRDWTPAPSLVGPGMVVVGWLLIVAGTNTAIDVLQQIGALTIVLGAVVSVLGYRLLFLFKPSVIALIFLFPTPGRFRQHIAIPLQHASAIAAEHLLPLFGVGVERSGILLELNGQQVAVAEACNGMRMVTALGLITFAFVFAAPMRTSVRVLLLLFSPLIALVVNVIRLIPTTLAYGYGSEDTALLVHNIGGWAVLGLALGLLWLIQVTLRWLEIPIDAPPLPLSKVPA